MVRVLAGQGAREDVEELTADVFLALWAHAGELNPEQGLRPWLWDAVEGLDEPDRTLFLRYYYYGDKLKDIARALGLTQTAAKQRLFRGRKALRDTLTKGGVEA